MIVNDFANVIALFWGKKIRSLARDVGRLRVVVSKSGCFGGERQGDRSRRSFPRGLGARGVHRTRAQSRAALSCRPLLALAWAVHSDRTVLRDTHAVALVFVVC